MKRGCGVTGGAVIYIHIYINTYTHMYVDVYVCMYREREWEGGEEGLAGA